MNTLFFRLLDAEDKGTALQQAVATLPQNPTPEAFAVNPESFEQVSGTPFAYWVSTKTFELFERFSQFEVDDRKVRVGLQTSDDFRFVRNCWEAPITSIVGGNLSLGADEFRAKTFDENKRWVPLAKGGDYSPYYADLHLVVNWENDGEEIKNWVVSNASDPTTTHWSRNVRSADIYFQEGLTWTHRTTRAFSIRVLPRGCVIGVKGPAAYTQEPLYWLGILQSSIFRALIELQVAAADTAARSYDVGLIQRTPAPPISTDLQKLLVSYSTSAWSLKRNLDTITQTSHAFIIPALLQVQGATLSHRAQAWASTVATTKQQLAQIQADIDALAFELYGISPEEVGAESGQLSVDSEGESEQLSVDSEGESEQLSVDSEGESDQLSVDSDQEPPLTTSHRSLPTPSDEDEDDTAESADLPSLVHGLIEYALGVALGRFDIRLATGEREQPPEPEPFDPLPACSPGMLVVERSQEPGVRSQKESGQLSVDSDQKTPLTTDHQSLTTQLLPPASAAELPPNYPINIPFNGILVDDEGHPNDIVTHIRQVLDLIWGDQAGDIEQEACQILKGSSLRDYFAKPNAFFAEHLSRYSKSRRYAPIYWPLSTRSGSYTLWLYYHRLTDQTLYTCINDYVEPKLHQVNQATTQLRNQPSRTRDEEKRLETLQSLELELIEFRDELLRIAQLPYKPNLNDGVQITAAPLWKLFGLKKWQTKLKDTWKKLDKGDYDWAHLAYTIWPERVREKCKGDKSLAIAHDLEPLYEAPPEKLKKSGRKL